MRYLNGYPGEPPPRAALSLGDSLAGMFAAQGVLTALLARDRSGSSQAGSGQVVDVALSESCLAVLESVIPDYSRTGLVREPSGTRLDGLAPSNLYRSADQRWLIVAANQDTVFRRLCTAMNRPELAEDPRFATHTARGENQDAIDEIVGEWVSAHTADEVTELLDEAGVVTGPVNTVADVVADPQFNAREMLVQHHDEGIGGEVLGPGVMPVLSATPGAVRWAGPPHPGTHNEEVYGELLGLSAQRQGELRAAEII